MKVPAFDELLNQRKPLSHILIMFFSLAATLINLLVFRSSGVRPASLGLFIMLFAQLEAFIFLGRLLFSELNFDRSPAEITRIVLIRFAVFMAGCLFVSLVLFIGLRYATVLVNGEEVRGLIRNIIHSEFSTWFRSTTKGLAIGATIFIILLWQTSLRREQKLKEEKLIFQNETLKNQVNPHFLFNSLNTISSLVQSDPSQAEAFINDLSSVYRYILENGQKDRVPLPDEIKFVNDYFSLHKVRDEDKMTLEIDCKDAADFTILPVSLQTLLENAIKHNKATRESPLRISVFIEGGFIVMRNNLQKKASQLKSTGIGLKNLSERLRLSSGKTLVIEESADEFIVKLPLMK